MLTHLTSEYRNLQMHMVTSMQRHSDTVNYPVQSPTAQSASVTPASYEASLKGSSDRDSKHHRGSPPKSPAREQTSKQSSGTHLQYDRVQKIEDISVGTTSRPGSGTSSPTRSPTARSHPTSPSQEADHPRRGHQIRVNGKLTKSRRPRTPTSTLLCPSLKSRPIPSSGRLEYLSELGLMLQRSMTDASGGNMVRRWRKGTPVLVHTTDAPLRRAVQFVSKCKDAPTTFQFWSQPTKAPTTIHWHRLLQ